MKRFILVGLVGAILGAGACLAVQARAARNQSRSLALSLPAGVTFPVVVTADGFLRLERVVKKSEGMQLDESAGFSWDGHDWRLLAPGVTSGPRVSLVRVDFTVTTGGDPSGVGTVISVRPGFLNGDQSSRKQGERFYVAATPL